MSKNNIVRITHYSFNVFVCALRSSSWIGALQVSLCKYVCMDGYHAQVWPLKMDPKLGLDFGSTHKATLNKDFDKFSIP